MTERQRSFRSVLPHEPVPKEEVGYLHCQGSFETRTLKSKNQGDKQQEGPSFQWTKDTLTKALSNSPWVQRLKGVTTLHLLETKSPFTKLRITFTSPELAFEAWRTWRKEKLTPSDLLSASDLSSVYSGDHSSIQFSLRQIQVTQLTQTEMPSTTIAWTRSNPPKFRRLLHTEGISLEQERSQARFVFITGLIDKTAKPPSLWLDSHNVVEAIRRTVSRFDSSGMGVEVFVPQKTVAYHCHVGMRSPHDAQQLIKGFQGQFVQWTVLTTDDQTTNIKSDKLFLDYADITQKSQARGRRTCGEEVVKGEPSRSECTSTTDGVIIPGLVLMEDYVSEDEEKALMAVLVGPHAPWAPSQSNKSLTGSVRRRVQHYGYVFDYETADVCRDRTLDKGACPPMPALPKIHNDFLLEEYVQQCVQQGRGWNALAGVIERTRKHDFVDTEAFRKEGQNEVKYSKINQLTINEYKQGEGIGSHVDTPHAFSDGLISISLNSGIVMEFKHTESDQKKLVFLPARSLLLMSGDARYKWEHQIVTRMTDTHNGKVKKRGLRVSLTLRTALQLPEDGGKELELVESNSFPPFWGASSNNANVNTSKTALATPSTERKHVHAVYDAIATQWHHTRGKRGVLWPGATQFLQKLPQGSVVADVGCGDGKYFPAIWEAGSYVIGTDISRPLLKTSVGASASHTAPDNRRVSEHRHQLRDRPAIAVADCMSVPLRTKSCDAAICIAVMHHLSTESRRLRCIEELARIVKVGGHINIQAWAMDQEAHSKRKFAATDVFVPFNAQPKYLDKSKQEESTTENQSVAQMFADTYSGAEFDERKGLVVFQRYCHLYRDGELEELSSRIPGIEVLESGFESGNYFVILRVNN